MFEYYDDEVRQQPRPPIGLPFGIPFGQPFNQPFGQGPDFGPPFGPPQVHPGQSGAMSGPPSGPPPAVIPQKTQQVGIYAVDPGSMRPCRFRYVYLWLSSGEQFWAWLVYVGRRSASGWRWTGFRWIYFGVDLRNIESFVCY